MATDSVLDKVGRWIAARITQESSGYRPYTQSDTKTLRKILRPGDVLLVEGNRQVSAAIKYLTQSTWSHAALYVGDRISVPVDACDDPEDRPCLVEVNLGEGCVSRPLSKYETFNTRICRPVGLTEEDACKVADYMIDRLGLQYDHSNIFDLLRYLLPNPPVPVRWRRRMIALGSGDPSRAICSSLIAQAFQSVRYPILPMIEDAEDISPDAGTYSQKEILHIRHHSLFTPRDFDLSPYFSVVKPTIEKGFDYKTLNWSNQVAPVDPLKVPAFDTK